MKSKSYLKALSFLLLFCFPNVMSAQWDTGGNIGLPEVKSLLGTIDNVSVKFITNNIERMRLTPNGNFGIGTDNPQRILHVNGAIRFQNLNIGTQTTALMIDANGDLSRRVLNNVAFSGNYNDLQNLPSLNIANWNTAYSWGNHAGLYKPIAWFPTWNEVTSKPTFATVATSGNYDDLIGKPNLNIANWDTAYSWGNHAGLYKSITWFPTWNEVTNKPNFATVATSGNYNDLINKPTLFDGNWSSLQGTAPAISSFTNDVGYITNADDADADPTNELQDLSLNEDFLSISGGNGVSLKGINYWSKLGDNLYYNSGKVGIGTDEPNKLLHLHSEDVFGIVKPDVAHSNFELQPKSLSIPISLLSSESALLLTNKNSGRTSADGLLIRSTNNNATISLQEEGELSITTKNSLRFKIQQNGNVSIGTPMTNFFTVKENGNVGIGTSDPVAKLHIKDDKIIVERNQKYIHINASNTDAEIGSSTGQIKFWYTNGVGYNDLYCKNLYCKDLYSNGNVGIGTDEPMFKLDVRGTGHFCKIKVKTQGFCDYVFNDDYKLMPLDELSEFIKINKHLPNIPSEKEVMEEGSFDLGEINKVLLEKIEELTLYILQQEERIKALEAEVKK